MHHVIKLAFVLLCCFGIASTCLARDYDNRTYIPTDAFVRGADGCLYAEINGELVLVVELFYSDIDGYYIFEEFTQYWVCSCCGYDLNIQRDECFSCKSLKGACECASEEADH